ncbi:MAG: RES family NAD+ phosphorylase [Elusimicrobia bacterium]|nr:RES family NAD+ phosphorylase [Elusimicrobiota bacterium]
MIPPHRYRAIVGSLARDEAAFPKIEVNRLFVRASPVKFVHAIADNGPSFRNEKARYNIPNSFSALYLADSDETAIEEARPTDSTAGRSVEPLVLARFHVKLPRVCDLTSEDALERLDLSSEDLRKQASEDDDHLMPRSLALYCKKKLRANGLLTSSATCEGKNLVIFPDRLMLNSVLQLRSVRRIRQARTR